MKELIIEMENYAKEKNIPIMQENILTSRPYL